MRRTPAPFLAIFALLAVLLLQTTAEAATREGLCRELRGRLVRGGGSASGLFVLDAESGRPVCARAAKKPRPLASNTKLFTTATALSRFGPEARIATKLVSDGSVDRNGVLRGNLYLIGGGDPALGTPAFYQRFLGGLGTNLLTLVSQIRGAGIRSVTGRLYADDSIFDRLRGVADSGYATSPYIGPLSGLSFYSGYSGAAARGFAGDPAKLAATTLAGALRKAGVGIQTGVALGVAPAGAAPVGEVLSPSMSRLVEMTDVYSNNFFAETLLKLIGARFGAGGSTAAGADVVERFAREQGSGLNAVDGSGLTRSNRGTPTQIVRLLQAMRGAPVGEEFIADLALTGREGTVASRMDGTAAEGRCRTKTGTLTGVSNLSGYCFNRNGKVMVFSILMGSVRNLTVAHAEQDLMAAAIAAY